MHTPEAYALICSLQVDLDEAAQALDSLIRNYEATLGLPDETEAAYLKAARLKASRARGAANRAQIFMMGQAIIDGQREY